MYMPLLWTMFLKAVVVYWKTYLLIGGDILPYGTLDGISLECEGMVILYAYNPPNSSNNPP